MEYKILVINPGSTSTKIAIFINEERILLKNVQHNTFELSKYPNSPDQLPLRRDDIIKVLDEKGYSLEDFDVFVGRGGGIKPCEAGVYLAEGKLIEHSGSTLFVNHPAPLGSVLAHEFACKKNVPAFTVDPPDTDEFEPVARITGLKNVERQSRFHALNQKEVARRVASQLGKTYKDINIVVAHLGGGISIGAHKKGRVIDSSDVIRGEGPMTPTRAGALPAKCVLDLCYSGEYSEKEMYDLIGRNSGIIDHLGTSDLRDVEKNMNDGDEYAKLVYDALIYQISKTIGAMSTVLFGDVDAIALTGGISNSKYLVENVTKRVESIAPVKVFPGEFEMEALVNGALRVLRGEEEVKVYKG